MSIFRAGGKIFAGLTLSEQEADLLGRLKPLYTEWNAKINVVSRKDFDAFEERHVLHSMCLASIQRFRPGSRILDVGTGGGFPGIPLAILHPEVTFILCDSIGKKIKVVAAVAAALGLKNVQAVQSRAESLSIEPVDFVISRAVTRLNQFIPFAAPHLSANSVHERENGILYLKGGDLAEELSEVKHHWSVEQFPIQKLVPGSPFFETKSIVYAKPKKVDKKERNLR